MAATRQLDYLLNLIAHPSAQNAKIKHLYLSDGQDFSFADDIKRGGQKALKIMENLAAFPNLESLDAKYILGELDAYELTPHEERDKQERQALVSRLLCSGISSSQSLKKISLIAVNPCYFQEILDSISKSQSMIQLDLTNCFPATRWIKEVDTRRIKQFVDFLRVNTSILALEQFIPGYGTLQFIEAIASNPYTAIKTINLSGQCYTNPEATQINELCKKNSITVEVSGLNTDFSHIALCDDLAAKKIHTPKETRLLICEDLIKLKLKTKAITIHDVILRGSKFDSNGLTYLITRFAYLMTSAADLKYVMNIIPKEHRMLVCERFLTDAKVSDDLSQWDIPELQAALKQRKQLQTTLGEYVPITPLQSIILSYTSTLFCRRERIVAPHKQEKTIHIGRPH